jgi:hypothetical protein
MKDTNGNWGFHTVKRGPKTKDCRFYLRFTDANGHQQRKSLPEGSTYEDAQRDRERQRTALRERSQPHLVERDDDPER